jgi:hypothetical protein
MEVESMDLHLAHMEAESIDDVMIRKERNPLGIFYIPLGGFIGICLDYFQSDFISMGVVPFIYAFCIYDAIKSISSHDINTWKYSKYIKQWLFIGCFFGGIFGIIVYYYFKRKEKTYLTKTIE